MIYPYMKLREDAQVNEITWKDGCRYEAVNARGEAYRVSERMADLLVKMEGGLISPYEQEEVGDSSEQEVDRFLKRMERCGLLERSRRFMHYMGPFFLMRLRPLMMRHSRLTGWLSIFLFCAGPISCVLTLLLFQERLMSCGSGLSDWMDQIVIWSIVIISLILHELAHASAAVSLGGKTHEIGILSLLIVPMGMYVVYEAEESASRFSHLIIALAGCNMNAVVGLVCMVLCKYVGPFGLPLLAAAASELILVVLNLVPSSLTDGGKVLAALVGVESLHSKAWAFFTSAQERRKLFRKGWRRAAFLIPAYLTAMLGQLMLIVWLGYSLVAPFLY